MLCVIQTRLLWTVHASWTLISKNVPSDLVPRKIRLTANNRKHEQVQNFKAQLTKLALLTRIRTEIRVNLLRWRVHPLPVVTLVAQAGTDFTALYWKRNFTCIIEFIQTSIDGIGWSFFEVGLWLLKDRRESLLLWQETISTRISIKRRFRWGVVPPSWSVRKVSSENPYGKMRATTSVWRRLHCHVDDAVCAINPG